MSFIVINTIDGHVGVVCNSCEEVVLDTIEKNLTGLPVEEITRSVQTHKEEGCITVEQ